MYGSAPGLQDISPIVTFSLQDNQRREHDGNVTDSRTVSVGAGSSTGNTSSSSSISYVCAHWNSSMSNVELGVGQGSSTK